MNRKLFFILAFSLLFFSCSKIRNDVILLIPSSQQEEIIDYFNQANISIKINNSLITIISPNVNVLINLLDFQYRNISLNKINIDNANTTRTKDGTYYKRKYLETLPNLKYIIKEDSSIPKKIYDPTHPDSIKEGKDKGYVYYPNINIEDEKNNLKNNVFIYNSILEYLRANS